MRRVEIWQCSGLSPRVCYWLGRRRAGGPGSIQNDSGLAQGPATRVAHQAAASPPTRVMSPRRLILSMGISSLPLEAGYLWSPPTGDAVLAGGLLHAQLGAGQLAGPWASSES